MLVLVTRSHGGLMEEESSPSWLRKPGFRSRLPHPPPGAQACWMTRNSTPTWCHLGIGQGRLAVNSLNFPKYGVLEASTPRANSK